MENNIISNWLTENGDPNIQKTTELNLAIATRINTVLESKNLKPVDLAKLLNKSQSEISKWLTGTHTFTTKTIAKISLALEADLVFTELKTNNVYFTVYLNEDANVEDTTYEKSEVYMPSVDLARKIS